MLILWSFGSKQKNFNHDKVFICDRCGQYGRYEGIMTFNHFSLFFIPIIKWNKRYFVKTTCCGTLYGLNPEVGKAIVRGNNVEIRPEHLMGVQGQSYDAKKRCSQCGYVLEEACNFCPECGNQLKE